MHTSYTKRTYAIAHGHLCLVYLVCCACVCVCVRGVLGWVLIVGYTEQYNAKVLAAKAAKRIDALHAAEAVEPGGPSGGIPIESNPCGPRTQPAPWFKSLWNMVGAGERWPITPNHLDSIRRKVVSQKQSVLQWLKISEQDGLWKRMTKKYQPRQALMGFITARLGSQVRPSSTCSSYDKAHELLSNSGAAAGLEKPCWQVHPGLCRTLDAAILSDCCAYSDSIVKYVRRIGSGSQRYLMFIRQSGDKRTHLLMYMPGSTLITSGPLVMFWGQDIEEMKVGGRVASLRRVHAGAEWLGNTHMYNQPIVSARAAAAGFQCGSVLRCHHLSQPGPRLKLSEPVSFTQYSLAKILQTAAGPAAGWAVYEAADVQKVPGQQDCVVVIKSWTRIDMAQGIRKPAQPVKASVESALKALPDDALLDADLLSLFSRLRHGKKSGAGVEQAAKQGCSKRRAFKRTQQQSRSDDSSTSDALTEATSDSDDGAGREHVQKSASQRNPRKRRAATQQAGADRGGAKKQNVNVIPGSLDGDASAGAGGHVGVGGDSAGASGGAGSSGGNGGGGAASSGAAGAAEPPAPPPPVSGRRAGPGRPRRAAALAGSRVVVHNGRTFCELWPDGSHSGYSLECKHHTDCVRDCTFGKKLNMSPQECRRRLLAWESAGAGLTTGSLQQQIEAHARLGRSKLLSAFAE